MMMYEHPLTALADTPLRDAAREWCARGVGALPVVDGDGLLWAC